MAVSFVPEHPVHASGVERLLDAAFGPGRFAKSSERVREGSRLEYRLSRVALSGRRVVGCCRIWPIRIGETRALFLGPIAVDPSLQNGGLGARLLEETLTACKASRYRALIVVGRPSFFGRFGFERVPDGRVRLPRPTDPERLQWLALKPGGLDGVTGPLTG
jgi:predicted N-acetyltransferase YhbS